MLCLFFVPCFNPDMKVATDVLFPVRLQLWSLVTWEGLWSEPRSSQDLHTVTHRSPPHLRAPRAHEKVEQQEGLRTHVPHSCLSFNKNKLTAEPWDSFLVFTPYKNFIDP